MAKEKAILQSAPAAIVELVQRFERNKEAYRSANYNETQVRREFIDPFFKALGWDIDNEAGLAEAYKDVIHEDAIRVGGASKAPDYCFRIGGMRKFFVEAKKPGVRIQSDPEPAYQIRRYAWSARLPLSILTDFEEFAVYDCRHRPAKSDRASKARTIYLTCGQYTERWDEIASIFAKDAILRGSFDKYAESARGKRGTTPVDAEFLKEIETWRAILARNFALRNPGLTARDLNFAVERTIDRIVFLRMCEDRGIELYGRLMALKNGDAVYRRLGEVFRSADDKYNAGLFYFRQEPDRGPPDELTLGLTLDDKVLKDIIGRLYYPDSPYEFSVLPSEILGQVYEQFLGKVIRLSSGHRARIEEKPEVRKAGGVYYTPAYVVDFIVQQTVGRLLDGLTPAEVGPDRETKTGKRKKLPQGASKIRVLDPACGSGSFLLGAYRYLLDWHRNWYLANGPGTFSDRIYQGPGGQWRLSIREKKRILLNNIYGVDIDPQAVEVTKLSLLLKVLENESSESVGSNLRLFHERALPDLAENIKCGNSLVGTDFYNGQQLQMFDEEERFRINAFSWEREFPDVFSGKHPGFDAVLGNPPYGATLTDAERAYVRARNHCYAVRPDTYVAFIEAGLHKVRTGGTLGMIVPSAMLGGPAYLGVREWLLSRYAWYSVVLLPYDVFRAYIDTCILCVDNASPKENAAVLTFEYPKRYRITTIEEIAYQQVPQTTWAADPQKRVIVDLAASKLLSRLGAGSSARLGDLFEIRRGVLPGPDAIRNRMTRRHRFAYFDGDVLRYAIDENVAGYVAFDDSLKERPKELKWFSGRRVLLRRLISRRFRLMAAVTDGEYITNKNLYSILPKGNVPLEALLGLLNSRLMSYLYVRQVTQATKDDFGQVTIKDICDLPGIPSLDHPAVEQIGKSVNDLLKLMNARTRAKTSHQQASLDRQVRAADDRIDALVYQLYGLTADEIRTVLEATATG